MADKTSMATILELAREIRHHIVSHSTGRLEIRFPDRVRSVDLSAGQEVVRREVGEAEFSRLPALERSGSGRRPRIVGYLHQLDVLGSDSDEVASKVRPILALEPSLPLDRALARLRTSGQRLALVGSPEAPRGLVLLMDLLAAISSAPKR